MFGVCSSISIVLRPNKRRWKSPKDGTPLPSLSQDALQSNGDYVGIVFFLTFPHGDLTDCYVWLGVWPGLHLELQSWCLGLYGDDNGRVMFLLQVLY